MEGIKDGKSMGKYVTKNKKEYFVEKAKKIHGSKYNYDFVEYKTSGKKVAIWCNTHSETFLQTPSNHLHGHGCPLCGLESRRKNRTISVEDFLARAKNTHGDKYHYDKVTDIVSGGKVQIFCKKHGGYFYQNALEHTRGKGCIYCNPAAKLSTSAFIEKAKQTHGEKYDYTCVNYINTSTPIEIRCIKHDLVFWQRPMNHLQGSGCPRCGVDSFRQKLQISTEEFIEKAEGVHGEGTYNYDLSISNGYSSTVDIICPKHGVFSQVLATHLDGSGCPRCSVTGFKTDKIGIVYLLSSETMIKVGITNISAGERCKKVNRKSPEVFYPALSIELPGHLAPVIEKQMLNWLSSEGLTKPSAKFDGFTESFLLNETPLDVILDKLKNMCAEVR